MLVPLSTSLLHAHAHAHQTVSDTLLSLQPKTRGIHAYFTCGPQSLRGKIKKEGRVFHPVSLSAPLSTRVRGNKEAFGLLRIGWKSSRFCDLLLGQKLTPFLPCVLTLAFIWFCYGPSQISKPQSLQSSEWSFIPGGAHAERALWGPVCRARCRRKNCTQHRLLTREGDFFLTVLQVPKINK